MMQSLPSRALETVGDSLLARSSDRRFPLMGQWEITCRCNLRCQMCYTDCFNTPDQVRSELRLPEMLPILDQIQQAGCLELTLTGGEPLAHPDFIEFYKEAHSRGLLLSVYTNGTLVTDAIADLWAERPPMMVEISMHGDGEMLFDTVTQRPGSYQLVRAAIDRLLVRGVPLTLKAVAMTTNKDAILRIKRFAESLTPKVGFIVGEFLRDDLAYSGAPYRFQLSDEERRTLFSSDTDFATGKEHDLKTRAKAEGKCGGGQETFHIDAYGRLQLCSGNRQGGYDLRRGSFQEGFYQALPSMPCANRAPQKVLHQLQPFVREKVEV